MKRDIVAYKFSGIKWYYYKRYKTLPGAQQSINDNWINMSHIAQIGNCKLEIAKIIDTTDNSVSYYKPQERTT